MAGKIIRRHKNGEQITDDELRTVMQALSMILPFLRCAGPEYHLVWKDMLLTQDAMKTIKKIRQSS
jgi:hypothetical protein